MRYVGYSEYYHDAALAIINEDGTVEFASQAERYSKLKNDPILHEDQWNLVESNDHISFYENIEWKKNHRKQLTGRAGKSAQRSSVKSHEQIPIYESIVYDYYNDHHKSHCATAFYTRHWSDKEDTVMVSIDGMGEFQTAVILDNNFNLIKEWHYPKSIGMVYTTATKRLGLRPLEDEYVVMGLSSYGEAPDEIFDWLVNWWEETPNISKEVRMGLVIDDSEIGGEGYEQFTRMNGKLKEFCEKYEDKDFAASIQKFAEYGIMQIMNVARQHGRKLVYSGGCAQNVVINSMIHEMFDDVHIAVAPTDAGSALGTAAMAWSRST